MVANSALRERANPKLLPPQPKIHALTSARFFAALYVVFLHTKWGMKSGSGLERFASVGFVSVCFFFLLSGYILASVYLRAGRPTPYRKFYVSRFARIYPLYIVSVFADIPWCVSSRVAKYGLIKATERVLMLVMGSAFMLQIGFHTVTIVNVPTWSLGVEAVFYLSFPFLGPLLWRIQRRNLVPIGVSLYLFSLLTYWVMFHYVSSLTDNPIPAAILPSYMVTFMVGVLVARRQSIGADKNNDSVSGWKAWTILVTCAAAFAVVVAASPWLTHNGVHLGLLLTPVFAASIWMLSSAQIAPIRWLSAKWLVVLGEASYGLYLVHVPVLHAFGAMHLTGSVADYPLFLTCSIGLSILSFYCFEKPARQWILHRFHTTSKETIEAATDAS